MPLPNYGSKPCKICHWPGRAWIDNEIKVRRFTLRMILVEAEKRGLRCSITTLEKHAKYHCQQETAAGPIPSAGHTHEFDPDLPDPTDKEEFQPDFHGVNCASEDREVGVEAGDSPEIITRKYLNDLLRRQLAIFRAKQRGYCQHGGKFPRDELNSLTSLFKLLSDYSSNLNVGFAHDPLELLQLPPARIIEIEAQQSDQ